MQGLGAFLNYKNIQSKEGNPLIDNIDIDKGFFFKKIGEPWPLPLALVLSAISLLLSIFLDSIDIDKGFLKKFGPWL